MPEVLLNQAQAAALAGLSLRHFARLLGEPGAPPQVVSADGRSKGIPLAPFRTWLRARIASELGGGETLSPPAERARLDKARADLAELDLSRKRGQLLPVAEVAIAWSEQIAIAKGRLLSLPSRVSADVLRLNSQRDIERVLKDRIITILEELAGEAARYGLDREAASSDVV